MNLRQRMLVLVRVGLTGAIVIDRQIRNGRSSLAPWVFATVVATVGKREKSFAEGLSASQGIEMSLKPP